MPEQICKKCGKSFEPKGKKGFICEECKKTAAKERKAKRVLEKETKPIENQISLDDLYPESIWEERPVDIETFLFDDEYLGHTWKNANGEKTLFPSWEAISKDIFPLPMRSPYNTIILSGGTGIGKLQPNFCQILTVSGFKTFGEIQIGDKILGKDGKEQRVVGVFPQGKQSVAKVIFNDGSETLCGYEHLWTVGLKVHGKTVWKTLELNEIISLCEYSRSEGKFGRGGFSAKIPTVDPIEYPHKDFKCDPYVLGAFLGNGCLKNKEGHSKRLTLSSGERDVPQIILEKIGADCFRKTSSNYNYYFYKKDGKPFYQSEVLPEEVCGFGSYDKCIPEEYFYGDVDQRLELLRGLLDTDGCASSSGHEKGRNKVHYTSVSKKLADGVVRLARSLGMFATVRECHRIKTYKEVSKEKISYRVSINSSTFNPFRVERKALAWAPAKKFLNRKIRDIEYYGEEECTCIKVSNEDGLYLTNDYIVTHNTSFAMGVLFAYYLHVVLCLRNPHEYFDLADSKNIVFAVLNIVTKAMAYKNAWGMLHKMLLKSPWFMARGGSTEGRRPEWFCTTKPVELLYGKCADDVIGLDILACMLDEVSFGRNMSIQRQIEIATEVFDAALERMKSRFTKFGGIYEGLMVMASSKRTDVSFLESFTKKLLDGADASKVYIVDKPRWEMLPSGTYSGKTFPVAVGDKFKVSEIIQEADIDTYKAAGYTIIHPPIENYGEFERDMQTALTNIAGISVGQISSFLRGDILRLCINPNRRNIFTESVFFSGYEDDDQYYERIDLSRCTEEDYRLPLFIHVDASLGSDGNSMVGVLVDYAVQGMNETGVQPELHYKMLFKMKVRAPQGTHTGLFKNRQLIFWLRQQGFNIRGISIDQYQSFETTQILERAGFNVKKQSIDAVKDGINQPYAVLKDAIYEKRIEMFEDEDLINELVTLEKYENGKVDKPSGGCFTGDTKIALVDGRNLTFLELIDEFNLGKINYVYSMDLKTKKIVPRPILRVWKTLENQPLVRVILDNGEEIKCTLNHRFMDRGGNYIEAKDLVPGLSLMPLYTKFPEKGQLRSYRLYYEPFEQVWHYEHRSFVGQKVLKGYVVHHINFNKLDNSPTNLRIMSRADHVILHHSSPNLTPEQIKNKSDKRKEWVKNHPEEWKEICQKIRLTNLSKKGMTPKKIKELSEKEKQKIAWIEENSGENYGDLSQEERSKWGLRYHIFFNSSFGEKSRKRLRESNSEISSERMAGRTWYNNGISEILLKPGEEVPDGFVKGRGYKNPEYIYPTERHWGKKKERKNHKVVRVEFMEEVQDVYDLNVGETHNFALASGVFVHNSDDVSQCLAGSVFLASQCKEELLYNGQIFIRTLTSSSMVEKEERPEININQEIEKHFATYSPELARRVDQPSDERLREDLKKFGITGDSINSNNEMNNPLARWG